ncbi:alpha/beta hydrolase, partial [Bacillus thuringiensis]|nr:alpha/beta hydrolase [Bacillus thuringiensis]
YIHTTLDRAIPIDFQRRMNTETPCKKIITLEADHSPFFSKASELVHYLNELN